MGDHDSRVLRGEERRFAGCGDVHLLQQDRSAEAGQSGGKQGNQVCFSSSSGS